MVISMSKNKGKKERELFSVRPNSDESTKKKKKRKKPELTEDDSEMTMTKKPKTDIIKVFEPLKFNSLYEGQVLLGCIREVKDYELLVSLPHKVMGTVPLTHISTAYTDLLKKISELGDDAEMDGVFTLSELYSAGEYVLCSVVSISFVNDYHRVHLSIQPGDVNKVLNGCLLESGRIVSCAVQSVEDKGYIMDCGISNVRSAYLPKSQTTEEAVVGVGSIVRCLVTQVSTSDDDNIQHLKLSAKKDDIAHAVVTMEDMASMNDLLPGTLISTVITHVCSDGLKLEMGSFEGIVSPLHLKNIFDTVDQYTSGKPVKARVMYVTSLSRRIHLTLNKDVCSLKVKNPLENLPIGQLLDDAEVYQSTKRNIYMKLQDKYRGYTLNNVLGANGEKVKNKHPVGSKHQCRVVQYNFVDRMFVISMKQSILDKQILSYKDVQVGQIIRAKIKSYLPRGGAIVALDKDKDGFVPAIHLTDAQMTNPELKHPVGKTVTAKVMHVCPESTKIHLTFKTALVESKLPILSELDDKIINITTHGTIVHIHKAYLLLEFCNGVRGIVRKRNTSSGSIDQLKNVFHVGQVVECKVLDVNPADKTMTLTMVLDAVTKPKDMKKKTLAPRIKTDCTVTKVTEDTVVVKVEGTTSASINAMHLSDNLEQSKLLFSLLKPGDEIKNGFVFRNSEDIINICLKSSFYDWMLDNNQKIIKNDVCEGEIVPGIVNDVREYGIMVCMAKGKSGCVYLVHKSNLCDRYAPFPDKAGFYEGQSLSVLCLSNVKGKVALSSALSKVLVKPVTSSLRTLADYFHSEQLIKQGLACLGGASAKMVHYNVGDRVSVEVLLVSKLGLAVKTNDGNDLFGFITQEHMQESVEYNKGDTLSVGILRIHYSHRCLQLSAQENVKLLHTKINKKITPGKKLKCEILMINKDYVTAMLTHTNKGLIVYLPIRQHLNDRFEFEPIYRKLIGESVLIVIKCIHDNKVFGILNVHNDDDENVEFSSDLPQISFVQPENKSSDEIELPSTKSEIIEKINLVIESTACPKENLKKTKRDSKNEPASIESLLKKKEKSLKKHQANQVKRISDLLNDDDTIDKEVVDLRLERKKLSIEKKKPDDLLECLELGTSGFVWDVPKAARHSESSSDEDNEDPESISQKKKRRKMSRAEQAAAAKEEEKSIHDIEMKKRLGDNTPETALEYEALIVNNPNSSLHWIQYIMFYLESAELDKAKATAKRAIDTIDKKLENEQLNMWTVLLRLQVQYGLPEEIKSTFKEATILNDSLKIHKKMAEIYVQFNKIQEAEDLYNKMTKKFKGYDDFKHVWPEYFAFLFKYKLAEKARHLLPVGLTSIPKNKHVDLLSTFAILEVKFGDPEKGITTFESLITNYPKRIDVWSVYVDLMVKRESIDKARCVLERMSSLQLRLPQMRFVFKKFLEFEKLHGTQQNVDAVKQRLEDMIANRIEK